MNIFADFTDRVAKTIEALGLQSNSGEALDLSRVAVEPPRDASHGDVATNAAMVLAKSVGENPRALGVMGDSIEVVNIHVNDEQWFSFRTPYRVHRLHSVLPIERHCLDDPELLAEVDPPAVSG